MRPLCTTNCVHAPPHTQSRTTELLAALPGCMPAGQPHVSLGIDNVPLMLSAAAVMLLLRKPVHLSHQRTGGLSFHVPFGGSSGPLPYSLQEMVSGPPCVGNLA